MSRSYKRNPVSTDGSPRATKGMKRIANAKVRKRKDAYNGGSYKKLFCSYEIHDYISRWSIYQARNDYYNDAFIGRNGSIHHLYQDDYPTFKDFYDKYWSKWYRRK